jgi:hypothetical protein
VAVLADILGLVYEPRILGRRVRMSIEEIERRVEKILNSTEGFNEF